MITRAIVEQIVSPYQLRVRIPLIDRSKNSSAATKTEDLTIATVCSLPRTNINLQPGDVVFVAFEDNQETDVVILGTLYRETLTETLMDQTLGGLVVTNFATLPPNTSIGDVSSSAIKSLKGADNLNIKEELDRLNIEIQQLKNKI